MKLNRGLILIALFFIFLMLFSINFNEITDDGNYAAFITIIGLAIFILLRSKK